MKYKRKGRYYLNWVGVSAFVGLRFLFELVWTGGEKFAALVVFVFVFAPG